MGKVLWHTMMSLDGFIAGPNDDMQWAFGVDGGAGRTIDDVLRSTGALLVGRRTQDVVKGVTGRFLDVSIGEAVRVAKGAANGGDVVVLGANVARQCLEAGMLDEIIVHVAPVLVGDGVRLFERAGGAAVKLEPISSADESQMTVLRYSVRRGSEDERA